MGGSADAQPRRSPPVATHRARQAGPGIFCRWPCPPSAAGGARMTITDFADYDAIKSRHRRGDAGAADLWVDDAAWSEAELPRREWVVPGYALRGAVTVVVGPPSAMKSSLMLAWACALALGRDHGRFRPLGLGE